MAITITHLSGPLAGKKPETFSDNVKEISFGRSGENDVTFPQRHETEAISREDIVFIRTGSGAYELKLRRNRYLEIDANPIPKAINNIPIESGSVIRLVDSNGPSFRVDIIVDIIKATPDEDTKPSPRPKPRAIWEEFGVHRRALIASVLCLSLALAGLAYYMLVHIPGRYEANTERLLENTYLVLKKNAVRDESTATAFVIGEKLLATNAHVAEEILKEKGSYYLKGPQGNRVEIEGVELHPVYKAFQFKRLTIGDVRGENFEPLDLQSAYDVGLITVKTATPLSEEALEIASVEEILALKPGTKLIAAGYPSEGIKGADHSAGPGSKPVPLLSSGEIRAQNDIFQTGDPGENLLVVHSLPVAGGVSGSPALDAWTGKVIAVVSGGNIVFIEKSKAAMGEKIRTPSAAMVNFAQRADLLTEMRDGTSESKLPARMAFWEKVGKNFAQLDEHVKQKFIAHTKESYKVEGDQAPTELEFGTLDPLGGGKLASRSIDFQAEPGFVYGLLAVLSGDPESQSRVDIGILGEGNRLLKTTSPNELQNDSFTKGEAGKTPPTAWVRVSAPTKLEVKLNGFIKKPVDYKLFLYKWPAPSVAAIGEPAATPLNAVAPGEAPPQ